MLNCRKADTILERVARQNNVSVDEVRSEIAKAIQASLESNSTSAKQVWDTCPKKGAVPTPEEAIVYLATLVK